MSKWRLLRDYSQKSDAGLGDFSLHVGEEMDGNINFKTPTVAPADLKTAGNNFIAAVAVCEDGTSQDTLHKNVLRAALIALLDQLAKYVELTANNDPEILTSSGFTLADPNIAKPAPVGTVAINAVTNAGGGSLNLDLNVGPNVWGFEVQVSTSPNVWVAAGYFTDPRNVTLTNLTPGTLYAIHARVHGSLNQISDWSDPVSHMAI